MKPVAPRAGAWIETNKPLSYLDSDWSPPARGRGLKLDGRQFSAIPPCRPPRGGVD